MDVYNLEIYKGSSFSSGVTLKDASGNVIDLTNYTVSGYLKYRFTDSGYLANLNPTKVAPYSGGYVTLSIAATGTAVFPVTIAQFDIEVYHTVSGTVDKVAKGTATIYPDVTY